MEHKTIRVEIRMTRKTLAVLAGALLLAAGLLVGGAALAQTPDPPPEFRVQSPDSALAATDVVSPAISYQGRLEEDGTPVNGTRDITFKLYSDEACSTLEHTVVKSGVPVADGLFTAKLGVTHGDFDGQRLWVGAEVDGTAIGCQEIMAAPYALSLRPGATVIGVDGSASMLYVRNDGNGTGVQGVSYGTGEGVIGASAFGPGVFGTGLVGPGVRAESLGGLALEAHGPISSTEDTVITANPLNAVIYYGDESDVVLRPSAGTMAIRTSSTGYQRIYVPVDVPTMLFGTPTKFKSARICYRCENASDRIYWTGVRYQDDSNAHDILTSGDDHNSTSWECYSLTASNPQVIEGSLLIRINMDFDGTGSTREIHIGKITVTLEE